MVEHGYVTVPGYIPGGEWGASAESQSKAVRIRAAPDDLAIINEIFRSAHTLKGMSSTMGFEDMAILLNMENVLEDLKEGDCGSVL